MRRARLRQAVAQHVVSPPVGVPCGVDRVFEEYNGSPGAGTVGIMSSAGRHRVSLAPGGDAHVRRRLTLLAWQLPGGARATRHARRCASHRPGKAVATTTCFTARPRFLVPAPRCRRRRWISPSSHAVTMHTSSSARDLSYASSGVDIDTEGAAVKQLIAHLGAAARTPGTRGAAVEHAGGFSGLIEFGSVLLALCTDGVGSKIALASQCQRVHTVPFDCVAMNVNDLICVGAEPLAFVDYIAAPRPDAPTWAALGRGLGAACRMARVNPEQA
eukprot:ctg_2689.g683